MNRPVVKSATREEDSYDPPSGQTHTCRTCGKQAVWQKGWVWYGSWRDWDDGQPIYKACSDECMAKMQETLERERIASNIEAAKADERRLEQELERKRRTRERLESEAAANPN